MIRVLIVDDQAIVRAGIRSMLAPEPDIIVVGEAGGGEEGIGLALELKPDVVLMDVRMPGMDGLTALERLKKTVPSASVIMVTLYDDTDYLLRAVSAGAAGYILKDAHRSELVRAVRVTADGGAIIEPMMLPQLLQLMGPSLMGRDQSVTYSAETLSPRELQVLRLIAEGCTNQEIADTLIVGATTIKTHVQNILRKLGVSDRTQAAVYAVRAGLV